MGLHFDGEYFSKSRDAGPYVPPSVPSDKYKKNYDLIRWDKDDKKETEND